MYDLKEYFVLLPTLKHFMKFEDKDATVRIYRFFRNLSRYTDISMDNNNVLLALETIDRMKDKDVCSLLELESMVNTTYILTDEEKERLSIIRENAKDETWRKDVEKVFEDISTHSVLSGRIRCLIACNLDDSHTFDFQGFKTDVQRFKTLFPKAENNDNVADDKTVLAFAAFCYERQSTAYPIVNGNYRDFGYYAGEWNLFIYGDKNHDEHIQLFGDFLHEIDEQDVEASKDKIINRLSADHPMYNLITKNMPCVLKNGEWHKRLSIHPTSGLIRLFQNTAYRSDKDAYLLGQEVLLCRESEQWGQWHFYRANVGGKEEYCLYTDHKIYDVAIDLLFTKISDNQYKLT